MSPLKNKVFSLLTYLNTWYAANPEKTILTNAVKHADLSKRQALIIEGGEKKEILDVLAKVLKLQKIFYAGKCQNTGLKAGVGGDTAYFVLTISINHDFVNFDASFTGDKLTVFI